MWFIITGLFFVTVTGNPAANRGERYSTTLEQNKWIKQLENPCRAPLNAETNQTRLTIEGQESVIRIMAGNMRSRLDMVQHKLVLHECPMDLESLSSVVGQPLINGSNLDLNVIYKSALLSSAHFRYMAEDWKEGNSCLNSHEDDTELRQAFERQSEFYGEMMCKLMATDNPSTISRPSNEMIRSLYQEVLQTQLYHFHDCAGRAMRDCRVFRTTQDFLQTLYHAATIATNLV